MPGDLSQAEAKIHQALGRVFPAAQAQVRLAGQVVLDGAYGWLDPQARRLPSGPDTRFDLASVTKLFVVTAFMRLAEAGAVNIDDPVSSVLPAFSGPREVQAYEDPLKPGSWVVIDTPPGSPGQVDAGTITFRHLLAHNSGLPAWRPLYLQGSIDAARTMALGTAFAYAPGVRTLYSDIGLILLGMAVERLAGRSLDRALEAQVLAPLSLLHTGYRSLAGSLPAAVSSIAPTEVCAWRGRRIQGEVHDENAAGLGGVAGHAGLFANAADVADLGQMYLERGRPLLAAETVAEMTRLQAQDGTVRRGLGFALWSADPDASSHPFSQRAFGHTGFTGTSLWVDPERELVVALLTNRVYYGRDAAGITALRVAFHQAIVDAL